MDQIGADVRRVWGDLEIVAAAEGEAACIEARLHPAIQAVDMHAVVGGVEGGEVADPAVDHLEVRGVGGDRPAVA